MPDAATIKQILRDVFPSECDALGPETVGEIVDGMSVVDPEEGSKYPLMEIAERIKEAVEFIAASLAIYATFRPTSSGGASKKEPSIEEVEKALEKSGPPAGKLTRKQRRAMLERVAKKKR